MDKSLNGNGELAVNAVVLCFFDGVVEEEAMALELADRTLPRRLEPSASATVMAASSALTKSAMPVMAVSAGVDDEEGIGLLMVSS